MLKTPIERLFHKAVDEAFKRGPRQAVKDLKIKIRWPDKKHPDDAQPIAHAKATYVARFPVTLDPGETPLRD